MDYRKFQTPYISNKKIEEKAINFRAKYWDGNLPVDIEKIIEIKLDIEIRPIPGLDKLCSVDTLISSNWKVIYIDESRYMEDNYVNRLRFSLAHEMGHFILHKAIYSFFKISDYQDFYNFLDLIPDDQYGFLEVQANKFASYLLLPRDLLEKEKEKLLKDKVLPDGIENEILIPFVAESLSQVFGVSAKATEIALGQV